MSQIIEGRVFSFSDRKCPSQPTGGPGGVNYRLLLANRRYHYVENMYHIFEDVIIEKDAMLSLVINGSGNDDNKRLLKYFQKLHEYYRFSDDDVYLFHDVFSAYVFISIFKVSKTVLIYHQQGSLYKEWVYFNGREDKELKVQLDAILKTTFQAVKYVAFPSAGAKESVIESDSSFQQVLSNMETKVLYNGCDNPDKVDTSNEIVDQTIQLIQESDEPVFITVAALNEAKGVERIPEYLAEVKAKYGPIKWIVVGDGVKAKDLDCNINKYNLQENVIWIKKRVPHDDIMALFMNSDFYILTHRFSIFDFSTIEAMYYGNIPILTPVGGNKEMIIEDNGVFINDLSSCAELDEYLATHDLYEEKQKNARIAKKLFSEEAFLNGYTNIMKELMQ